jgi:predicted nucleotidyltransferase
VIEIPISDELDIGVWDLRKALKLANKGNAVVQEWMISPIVYKCIFRPNVNTHSGRT